MKSLLTYFLMIDNKAVTLYVATMFKVEIKGRKLHLADGCITKLKTFRRILVRSLKTGSSLKKVVTRTGFNLMAMFVTWKCLCFHQTFLLENFSYIKTKHAMCDRKNCFLRTYVYTKSRKIQIRNLKKQHLYSSFGKLFPEKSL